MATQGGRLAVTLALSGGGAKCAAQAGALPGLLASGLDVRALAGVSGGGFVAVLYALGWSPLAIRDFVTTIHLLELWDFHPSRPALLSCVKLRALIVGAVGDHVFGDLALPVTLVAADLATGQEVYLNSGRLDDALLATMALPGVLPPHALDGRQLVDGAVASPLPVRVARQWGYPVIAIDVGGPLALAPVAVTRETPAQPAAALGTGHRLGLIGLLEVVTQAITITSDCMRNSHLLAYPPAVLIQPPVHHIGMFSFHQAPEAYTAGEAAAEAARPRLAALVAPELAHA